MDRRSFFRNIGVGAVAAKVAPSLIVGEFSKELVIQKELITIKGCIFLSKDITINRQDYFEIIRLYENGFNIFDFMNYGNNE